MLDVHYSYDVVKIQIQIQIYSNQVRSIEWLFTGSRQTVSYTGVWDENTSIHCTRIHSHIHIHITHPHIHIQVLGLDRSAFMIFVLNNESMGSTLSSLIRVTPL
jgi:hypothetical protein